MAQQNNKSLDEKIRLFVVIAISVLSAITILLLVFHDDFHSLAFPQEKKLRIDRTFSILSYLKEDDGTVRKLKDDTGEKHDIMFEYSSDFDKASFACKENAVRQEFSFTLKGLTEEYFSEFNVLGDSNFVTDIKFSSKGDTGTVTFFLKDIYLVKYSVDGSYLCFDFVKPSDIFDRIIVLDAACGGEDRGTVKGDVAEKDINLSILLKIKEDFEENQNMLTSEFPSNIEGISVVNMNGMKTGIFYTRTDDTDVSYEERAGLANRLDADCLVSVKMNSTASGRMSEICGTEVLYRVSDADGASKELADRVLSNLLDALGSNSKGTVAGDEEKLIASTKSPVCIAEPGFMTNQEELDLLSTDDYQKKIADAIYQALIN